MYQGEDFLKKTNDNYYWCKDMQSCNRGEWNLCEPNEGLFTSGEIQGDWSI
jgi:threonine dehydrogenase-like Zn-dependent dehydrogenase